MTALRFTPLTYLETRSLEASGRIEGLAATFMDEPDCYGDVIAHGAFADSLTAHTERKTAPAMLWSHAIDTPVGKWTNIHETRSGLEVVGSLNLQTPNGRDAHASLKHGDLSGLSIGFMLWAGGADSDGHVRMLKRIDLVEISVVAVPANRAARIRSVKSLVAPPSTIRELEGELRSMGFSQREAASIATRGFTHELTHHNDDDLLMVHARLQALVVELKGSNHGR